MNTILISHAECNDGTMAAAVMQHFCHIPDSNVFFVNHGNVHNDFINKGVYDRCTELTKGNQPLDFMVVDFSLPKEVIDFLLTLNPNIRVTIIDHHIGAKEAYDKFKDEPNIILASEMGRFRFLFDNRFSGCMLTLAYCITGESLNALTDVGNADEHLDAFYDYLERPNWRDEVMGKYPHLLHVEDRDIWKWQYPQSKAFTEVLIAKAHTLPEIRQLFPLDDTNTIKVNVAKYVTQGEAILEYQDSLVDQLVKQAETCSVVIDGVVVYGTMVNAIKQFSSDLGNKLSSIYPHFALIYRVDGDKVEFSVRSQSIFNSRVISEYFGGGGHNQASGFKIPLEKMYETLSRLKYGDYEINTKRVNNG